MRLTCLWVISLCCLRTSWKQNSVYKKKSYLNFQECMFTLQHFHPLLVAWTPQMVSSILGLKKRAHSFKLLMRPRLLMGNRLPSYMKSSGFIVVLQGIVGDQLNIAVLDLQSQSTTFAIFPLKWPTVVIFPNVSVTKQKADWHGRTLCLCYFCSEMTHPCHLSAH